MENLGPTAFPLGIMDRPSKEGSPPAISEASGDSETDRSPITPPMIAGYDDDDAESSSGSGGDDAPPRDERWMSWRSWLIEYASRCKYTKFDDKQGKNKSSTQITEENGLKPVEEKKKSTVAEERESHRLFWEACLAHGYP